MSGVEWTDAEREAAGGHQVVHGSGNWPWRCECGQEFRTSTGHARHVRDAILGALAPFVAAREAQAAARALREAEADYSHLYLTRGAAAKVVAAVTCADLGARADRIERGES